MGRQHRTGFLADSAAAGHVAVIALRRILISLCSVKTLSSVPDFKYQSTLVKPCSKVLQSLKDFPTPSNVTDIRSWSGLVNQVAYAFAVANNMRPFRDLLKPDQPFTWTEHLDYLFRKSTIVIIGRIKQGVEISDQTRSTCIATDWSQEGLGYWLSQKHCDCMMLNHSAVSRAGK